MSPEPTESYLARALRSQCEYGGCDRQGVKCLRCQAAGQIEFLLEQLEQHLPDHRRAKFTLEGRVWRYEDEVEPCEEDPDNARHFCFTAAAVRSSDDTPGPA